MKGSFYLMMLANQIILNFPYWTYPPFDLEKFSDNKYNAEFLGFLKAPCTA